MVPVARFVACLLAMFVLFAAPHALGQQKLNRRDVEKLIAEADKLASAGQNADARLRLMPIVQQDPTNAPVALKLARLCHTLKDWDCAAMGFQIAASNAAGPDKAAAHAGLADVHLTRGSYADAAENARAALALDPADAASHVTLAVSLVRQGSRDALPAARKAVELVPDSAPARLALAEALYVEGQHDEAEASFRKVLDVDPQSAAAHARIAELLFRKADLDGVIAAADRALALDKGQTTLYSIRGRARHSKGDDDQAIVDLQHAVTVKQDDTDAHLVLGRIYERRGNLDLAERHYRHAAGSDGRMGDAQLGLASVLVAKKDFDAAREPVERVASSMPQSAQAQYLLGVLREQQQQYDAAVKAYEAAAALDAKLAAAHHGAGRVLREHLKDPARAVPSLERAAALTPEDADVLSDLGVALYETKQQDRAYEMLKKAAASPGYKSPMGLTVLGIALKDRQQFAEALGYFEQAAELAPKWWLPQWGVAWSHFGLIKTGCPCGPADEARVKQIKSHYDTMVALDGKDPALQQRVDALLKGLKVR